MTKRQVVGWLTESGHDLVDRLHLHLSGHQVEELWEVNGPITISIHLIDHVLQLSFSGILTQRPHHCAKLLGCDGAFEPGSKVDT